jgi:hypothetical protein
MYILIILFTQLNFLSGTAYPVATSTAEFSSKQTCMMAKSAVEKQSKYKAICVEK